MEKINVFVVEDNPTESLMMKMAFGGLAEVEITYFPDGAALLEALDQKPEMLILDLMLPDIEGMDLLALVNERSPDTRTVIVSAQEDINVIGRAQREGVFNYVVKNESCLRYLRRVIEDLTVIVAADKKAV